MIKFQKNQLVKVSRYERYIGVVKGDEQLYETYQKEHGRRVYPEYVGRTVVFVHLFPKELLKKRTSQWVRGKGMPLLAWKEDCTLFEAPRKGHHLTKIFK